MDRFASLPPEVFTLIIDKIPPRDVDTLYKCIFANKHFYRAIMPILRHSLVFYHKATIIRRPSPMDRKGTHVIRALKFKDNIQWSDMKFLTLVNHANLLEECILPFTTRIAKGCIQQLPLLCPNLTSLHLGDPFGHQQCLNCMERKPSPKASFQYHQMEFGLDGSTLLDELVLYPSLLERLSIVHPPPQFMATMTTHPQISLERLTRFDRLTHLKLHFVPKPLLHCIFTSTNTLWPFLIHLAVAGDLFHPLTPTLAPFLQSHPGIQELHFVHCSLWDATIDTITEIRHPGLSELRLIDITGGPRIARSTFLRLMEATLRLTSVDVEGFTITAPHQDVTTT